MKPPSGHPQQGAMFNVKPAASHQWPRGYTPDRLHETQDALGKIRVSNMSGRDRSGAARYNVTSSVARSTAPLGDPKKFPTVALTTLGANSAQAGYYKAPTEGKRGNGHISILADPVRADQVAYTALHEIGHHTDFQADPQAFRARALNNRVPIRGGSASPALEGYAEGFATSHYVPDHRGVPHPLYAPNDKNRPHVEALNPDQMRGYDRPFGGNATYQQHFARGGADPARINSARRPALDLSPRTPPPAPEQGKLF